MDGSIILVFLMRIIITATNATCGNDIILLFMVLGVVKRCRSDGKVLGYSFSGVVKRCGSYRKVLDYCCPRKKG